MRASSSATTGRLLLLTGIDNSIASRPYSNLHATGLSPLISELILERETAQKSGRSPAANKFVVTRRPALTDLSDAR